MSILNKKQFVNDLDPFTIKKRLFFHSYSINNYISMMKGCEGITVDYVQLPYTLTPPALNLLKMIQRFDKSIFFTTHEIERVFIAQLATCQELTQFELSDFRTNVITDSNNIGITIGRPIYDRLKTKGVDENVNATIKQLLTDRICSLSWAPINTQPCDKSLHKITKNKESK